MPEGVAKINTEDTITQGLVFAAYPLGSCFYDAVSGLVSSKNSGNNKHLATVDGNCAPAIHGAGASGTGGLFAQRTGADRIAGVHSVFVEARLTNNASVAHVFRSFESGNGDAFGLVFDDISLVTNGLYYTANNADRGASLYGALGENSENFAHRVAMTNDGVNTRFYTKGRLNCSVAGTTLPNANNNRRTSVAGSNGTQAVQSVALALVWNRPITLGEYQRLFFDPEVVFGSEDSLLASLSQPQIVYPTGDVAGGTWLPSTGTDLYACIDETAASDADYISTVNASTCEVALSTLSDPASSSGHIVRYRLSAEAGGVTVRLRQGTTTIASWTHSPAPASLTTYAQTLSGGEADSITDYTALKLQFEATE